MNYITREQFDNQSVCQSANQSIKITSQPKSAHAAYFNLVPVLLHFQPVCLSVCLSVCMSTFLYLSVCLSVCLSLSLSVSLSLSLSFSTLLHIVHYFYTRIHRWSSYRNQSFMLSHLYTNRERITWTQNLCSEFANSVMNDIEEMTVRN